MAFGNAITKNNERQPFAANSGLNRRVAQSPFGKLTINASFSFSRTYEYTGYSTPSAEIGNNESIKPKVGNGNDSFAVVPRSNLVNLNAIS